MGARAVRRRQTIFVGDKIRQLRKERSLTQAELAHRIGVQQSDLCRMENGEYKVALDTLFRILSVFGMDIGDFFREDALPLATGEHDQEFARLFHRLDEATQLEVIEFLKFKATRTDTWRE